MDIFQQAGSKRKSVSEFKNYRLGSYELLQIYCAILHSFQIVKLRLLHIAVY